MSAFTIPRADEGKEATLEEREEAERVLKNAFRDAKERDQMRTKVSKASPADLQAMLLGRAYIPLLTDIQKSKV